MNNHTPMDDEAPIEDPEEELRPDKSDYAHTGAKVVITTAVTAAGTLIGGPLGTVIAGFLSPAITEFYNHVVTAPLSRREAVWLTKVYDSLKMIEAQLKDFDPSKVFEDPATFTAFLHASHIARRTHQEEKLNVLRNAVLNVALATAPEDSLQMIFLDIIDVTTPEHWRILEFLLDSGSYAKKRGVADLSGARIGGAEKGLFERTFPELVGHDQLVIAIVQDLYTRGLIVGDEPTAPWYSPASSSGESNIFGGVTPLGRLFLEFIKFPGEEELPILEV